MAEQRTDEARLANAMREYTDGGPPAPDPVMLARATVARSRAQRSALGRVVSNLGRLGLAPAVLLLALLAVLALGLVIVGTSPSLPAPPIPADRGVFTRTGRMSESREKPTLTRLQDGRVLVVAGFATKASAELFDPVSGEFTPAGDMATARWGQTATLLEDGRVLVTGGTQPTGPAPAEVWDPRTLSFTPVATPAFERFMGRSELLPDGRVLISGGRNSPPDEVWDPTTGEFAFEPTLGPRRPDGTPLGDGRILVIDGRSAEIWDPATGTMSAGGTLLDARDAYGMTATLLQDGRVLLPGGEVRSGEASRDSALAEIWDPSSLTSTATGRLTEERARHSAVLLADGRVLLAGANYHLGELSHTAELFELR